MHPRRSALAAATAALVCAMAFVAPAAAYTVVSESGTHGHYLITDSFTKQGATCSFGNGEPPYGWAWLDWMTARAPKVFAADRNSSVRDHRKVSWQFKIQRAPYNTTAWQTVASSAVQKATAWDDQAASFSYMKITYDAHTTASGSENDQLRALIILKWYKPSGAVEGTVQLAPSYYRYISEWSTNTAGNEWCGVRATEG